MFQRLIPFAIGLAVGALMFAMSRWWGFLLIFPWIGGWVSVGLFISASRSGIEKQLGRRVAILAIMPIFIFFIGVFGRENLQIEELVFCLGAGLFSGVVVHYAIAKVLGPLGFGRVFCGWACWHAAVFEWLPIRENKPIPKRLTHIRWIILIASVAAPLLLLNSGYDFVNLHYKASTGRIGQFVWFLIGNGVYFASGIVLAFVMKKKRAFCKVLCPVALVMKPGASLSSLRVEPTGEECTECGECDKNCPMDVPVMSYIRAGEKVRSTECILCETCKHVCPTGAIKT
jgi:ferredoxin-type protein NapH